MGEDRPKTSWWKTLPGVLSGIAAILTALGGFVVALNQAGFFTDEAKENGTIETRNYDNKDISDGNSNQPETIIVSGIDLPAYVVLDSAWETKKEAQRRLVSLNHSGYSNTGYFWVPDFQFLSGAELFQVYIGPFSSKSNAIGALCQYNNKFEKTTYGVKLSHKPGREEIRCN